MTRCLILGIDSVGRKTIVAHAKRLCTGHGLEFHRFSELMHEFAQKFGIDDSNLAEMDDNKRRSLQFGALGLCLERTMNDGHANVVIGHAVVAARPGFISGMLEPEYAYKVLGISNIVLIRSEDSSIKRRRDNKNLMTPHYTPEQCELDHIKLHQILEKEVAAAMAFRLGIRFNVIDRKEGNGQSKSDDVAPLSETAGELLRILSLNS